MLAGRPASREPRPAFPTGALCGRDAGVLSGSGREADAGVRIASFLAHREPGMDYGLICMLYVYIDMYVAYIHCTTIHCTNIHCTYIHTCIQTYTDIHMD